MSVYIPRPLRREVRALDKERCAFCQAQEAIIGQLLEVDHIQPTSAGGKTVLTNLCLACRSCNNRKSNRLSGHDATTNQDVPLYNPRSGSWDDHFEWVEQGLKIVGLTPVGRATINALDMNNSLLVRSRAFWIIGGWHPPNA